MFQVLYTLFIYLCVCDRHVYVRIKGFNFIIHDLTHVAETHVTIFSIKEITTELCHMSPIKNHIYCDNHSEGILTINKNLIKCPGAQEKTQDINRRKSCKP